MKLKEPIKLLTEFGMCILMLSGRPATLCGRECSHFECWLYSLYARLAQKLRG